MSNSHLPFILMVFFCLVNGQNKSKKDMHAGLSIGVTAPDVELATIDGTKTSLYELIKNQDAVLILGSYTCPPFRNSIIKLSTIAEKYSDKIKFYYIYIKEAHPVDGWRMKQNDKQNILIKQHTNIKERCTAADIMINNKKINIPVLTDSMKDSTLKAFGSWPNRIVLINNEKIIKFYASRGPKVGEN